MAAVKGREEEDKAEGEEGGLSTTKGATIVIHSKLACLNFGAGADYVGSVAGQVV